jgi:phosphatidylinositol glycan class Z
VYNEATLTLSTRIAVSVGSMLLGLGVLSTAPHQEVRFLLPMLLPGIVALSGGGVLERVSRVFWVSWILYGTLTIGLFGWAHQGGIVPALGFLHSEITHPSCKYERWVGG